MAAEPRVCVDHQNGNTLDNRRENLRICTRQQNSFNKLRSTKQGQTASQFKGVSWYQRRRMWQASIGFNMRKVHIGFFATEEAAALAYNAKASELHGQFASLNHVAIPPAQRIVSPLDV